MGGFDQFWKRGGQSNLSGQPETNTEEMALLGDAMWGVEDFIMDDLVDVVEDGRLGIRGEQVQMAEFQGGKERSLEEEAVLTALALMGEVIAGQCQLELQENQDRGINYWNGCFKSARNE